MKAYKVIRWILKASTLAAALLVMQACDEFPFSLEMHRASNEKVEADTTPSEDLQFWGLDHEDWQSGDDPIIP